MNIIIVCYPTYGGSGILATELGNSLAQKGHEVHFVTYQQPVRLRTYSSNIFFHEVDVPPYPLFNFPPYELALAGKLVNIAIQHHIDIVHVHYAIPHASAAYIMQKIVWQKHQKYIPFITTLHGTDITIVGRDKSYEPVVTFSINNSDIVTAVSQNLKDETYKHFEITKKIEVIYNFIDTEKFKCQCNPVLKNIFAPQGQKILVHASNFRKVKRIQDVIKIFEIVNEQVPVVLLMVGDGPERKEAEEYCIEHQLNAVVKFLGKQDDIQDIFAICDIFLLPSDYESFGLSALEAMASFSTVVSSNAGGLPEVNIHNFTGFTADVGNVQLMAQYCLELLNDNEKLLQFKHNAMQHAKQFNHTIIIPQYETLYQQLLEIKQPNI
ncbi:MAG: N-acetyl-alpha-D-glucosaminyl L-malate synthase BshA [Alphaproteobacteria bacterium]|nr:N-acetyl-alpha-D-glucosaminyl L-malate synthase BshA [Alphaproteobacteria bacterium]